MGEGHSSPKEQESLDIEILLHHSALSRLKGRKRPKVFLSWLFQGDDGHALSSFSILAQTVFFHVGMMTEHIP